jgi:oxygen-dependent protoporphyrinogen oxidase
MEDVIIIGGGIAGLTTAYRLVRAGKKVVCLEAADYPGGCIRTDRLEGYLCERGAQNFMEAANGPVYRLANDLGLADQIIPTKETGNYIAWEGRSWVLPKQILRILSPRGLARAGLELFLPRRSSATEESIAAWARRRFGHEVAQRLIDPMVTGVWAGDPERLSLEATLSVGAELEQKYRSVILGAFKNGGERQSAFTFKNGMGTLPETLAKALGSALHTGNQALNITPIDEAGYRIQIKETKTGSERAFEAKEVVIATPPPVTGDLVAGLDSRLAELIRDIPCSTMVSCSLAFLPADFIGPGPKGYGLISPYCQGTRALGCLYPSSSFAGASPPDRILIRILLGGRRDPEAITLSDAAVVELALQEFGPLLGLKPDVKPAFVRIFRHRPGLPQYELGHLERLANVEARAKRLAGLHLVGNSYRGIPVRKVIEQAEQLAQQMLTGQPVAGPQMITQYEAPASPPLMKIIA